MEFLLQVKLEKLEYHLFQQFSLKGETDTLYRLITCKVRLTAALTVVQKTIIDNLDKDRKPRKVNAKFASHLETKVPESGGRAERHTIQDA